MLNFLPKRKTKAAKKELSREAQIWKGLSQPILGMFIFTILPFILIGMDFATRPVADYPTFLDVVSDWQGMVAGSFALLAAAFAARAVVLQISWAEAAEQTRLEEARTLDERNTNRALMAARSVMPLTLNVLSDYTTAIAKGAITVLNDAPHEGIRLMAEQLPELPSAPRAIISDLQAFIVAAPDDVGANVADMLSDLQLLSARAENIWQRTASENEVVTRWNYEDLVGRAAVLYARQAGLFAYARRETEQAPGVPLQVYLAQALQLWRVWPDIHPQCHERAEYHLKKAQDRAA